TRPARKTLFFVISLILLGQYRRACHRGDCENAYSGSGRGAHATIGPGPARIYLDHHATTPVDPEGLAAMLPWFTERFGNPSSRQHVFGQEGWAAVEEARSQVAGLVGAAAGDIVFTSGATESNNLALRGAARGGSASGRHVVTSAIEHPAVLEPLRTLE